MAVLYSTPCMTVVAVGLTARIIPVGAVSMAFLGVLIKGMVMTWEPSDQSALRVPVQAALVNPYALMQVRRYRDRAAISSQYPMVGCFAVNRLS